MVGISAFCRVWRFWLRCFSTFAKRFCNCAIRTLIKRRSVSNCVSPGPRNPTAPFQKENPGEFAKYSQNLSQSHYILAETVSQVDSPAPTSEKSHPKKNNYDFLKKSQIYNKKSKQKEQERQVAQELNLTRMSE